MLKSQRLTAHPYYDAFVYFLNRKFDGEYRNLSIRHRSLSRRNRVRAGEPVDHSFLDVYLELGNTAPEDINRPDFPELWREEYLEALELVESSSGIDTSSLIDAVGLWDVEIFVNFNNFLEDGDPAGPGEGEVEGSGDYSDRYYERGEVNYLSIKVLLSSST